MVHLLVLVVLQRRFDPIAAVVGGRGIEVEMCVALDNRNFQLLFLCRHQFRKRRSWRILLFFSLDPILFYVFDMRASSALNFLKKQLHGVDGGRVVCAFSEK